MTKDEVWHIGEIVLAWLKSGRPAAGDIAWLHAAPHRADYALSLLHELR